AIAEYAAAENRLHAAVLKQYPQIHLQPGYYWDHGIAKFPLNAAFELPIFNHNEGEIADMKAARDVAGQRMLAVQAEIIGAIDASARSEHDASVGLAAAQRGLDAVRVQRGNAARSLQLGGIDATADLAAEMLVLRSELETVLMRSRLQSARNTLEDALHAPLS